MTRKLPISILSACVALLSACGGLEDARTEKVGQLESPVSETARENPSNLDMPEDRTQLATLGAGCYWCVEAVLQQVDGVIALRSGFMGGDVENPTYKDVCSGRTGHAEVVEVEFDPSVISYDQLLEWFWKLHDPTTLNRQGADTGTQYRSAIFTHSDEQASAANASIAKAQADFSAPIVTEVTPASTFYLAKSDHQDYYRNNRTQGYCRMVIAPKLDKLGLER